MQGPVDLVTLLCIVASSAVTIGGICWIVRGMLATQNAELIAEITRSRHLLRNELQGVQGSADAADSTMQKQINDLAQRTTWLEAKTNGKDNKR